jgi:hypothetical protein
MHPNVEHLSAALEAEPRAMTVRVPPDWVARLQAEEIPRKPTVIARDDGHCLVELLDGHGGVLLSYVPFEWGGGAP